MFINVVTYTFYMLTDECQLLSLKDDVTDRATNRDEGLEMYN